MPFCEHCAQLGHIVGASRDKTVDAAGHGAGIARTGHEERGLVAPDDGFSNRRLPEPGRTFFEGRHKLLAIKRVRTRSDCRLRSADHRDDTSVDSASDTCRAHAHLFRNYRSCSNFAPRLEHSVVAGGGE